MSLPRSSHRIILLLTGLFLSACSGAVDDRITEKCGLIIDGAEYRIKSLRAKNHPNTHFWSDSKKHILCVDTTKGDWYFNRETIMRHHGEAN